ncbi:MAG TPA: hypothetical protein O0X19_05370 [Methanocorpusculum sp.]|nr:hypothetical protein [Methanocorpusculum sp.]
MIAALCLISPAAADSEGTSIVNLSAFDVSVQSDSVIGNAYTLNGEQKSSAVAGEGGSATVVVTASIPAGRELKITHKGTAEFTQTGNTLTVKKIKSNIQINLSAVTPSPSPSPSGGGSVWVQPQDILAVITTDVTSLYSGVPFFAATAGNLAEIQSVYPLYADELAEKFAAAEAAGYKLVNSRGAPALAVLEHPDEKVIKETFCKVYEVTPVYPGAKIEKVEIPVPMTDITATGLTYQDVSIYHGVDLPGVANPGVVDLWIPLEILNITFDEKNYYFTAATDGASPFGVLIKHFEPEGTEPGPLPTPVPKTAVPVAGLLAGLGAAGVLLGLKRK